MFRKTATILTVSILVLAACGGDGGTTTTAAQGDPGTTTAAPADPGGARGGTITIDGTTYAFVASQQCLIAADFDQYYISGDLPEVENGYLAYSRDADVHELRVDIGDVGYTTFFADDMESTIAGNVVTGSVTLFADDGSGDVPAEFRFEC